MESTEYAPADAFFASLSGEARPAGRLAPLADLGGSAMTLALARAGAEPGRDDDTRGLALAVGPATRRGLPSSGRVHVGGRSPLTGAYTEGAVGGDLAWALASFASGLLVTGPARPPGAPPALLAIDARDADEGGGRAPRVELVPLTDLGPAGLDPGRGILDLAPALDGYLPAGAACPRALLLAGPAARRGLPFATLMAWTAGAPPLVTGRGGLGLVLAELGLAGILVVGGEAPGPSTTRPSLQDPAPAASPRLVERSRSGTFELFGAYAARGELAGRNYAAFLTAAEGRAIAAEAVAARSGQHGCKGCPTPCGLVFERGRSKGGARFSATWALGPNLGFAASSDEPDGAAGPSAFAAALTLLERCDDQGIDAREAGACLALLARATELGRPSLAEGSVPTDGDDPLAPRYGDLDALARALDHLPARGSAALAADLGLEHEHVASQGQAARPEANLAAVLGQVVSTAGNDPLRAFPFTVARGGHDPRDPAGKGRLVAWHEDLAAALDLAGFCGFSAAGLLVDGVLDLDELATWILPSVATGEDPGRRLLEAGRALVLARRALDRELGRSADLAPDDLPTWAREDLLRPGMLDGYLAERGLDGRGELTVGAVAWLAGADAAPWGVVDGCLPGVPEEAADADEPDADLHADLGPRAPGVVLLRASGRLAEALAEPALSLDLPATLAEVLDRAASDRPAARRLLLDPGGRPLPAVWRDGRPLAPADPVHDGDSLDLLLAIAGG